MPGVKLSLRETIIFLPIFFSSLSCSYPIQGVAEIQQETIKRTRQLQDVSRDSLAHFYQETKAMLDSYHQTCYQLAEKLPNLDPQIVSEGKRKDREAIDNLLSNMNIFKKYLEDKLYEIMWLQIEVQDSLNEINR